MSNFEREGRTLLAEADKKASHKGWFGGNKLEDASDLYAKAANAFKLAKKCKDCHQNFESYSCQSRLRGDFCCTAF